jgi:hypothetical protein
MNKFFTFTFALLFSSASFAQNFEFNPSGKTVNFWGPSSSFEHVGHAYIKNVQGSTAFTWKRVVVSPNTPAQWSSAICDNISCWDVGVGRNNIVIAEGDSSLLDLHVYPAATPGSGTISIAVWTGTDSANADTIVYNLNAWPASVNNVKKDEKLLVYPNPARGSITLSFETSETVKVEIYDVLGKLVKTGYHSTRTSSINIEDLHVGLYVIRVYEKDQTYSKTFKKIQ